ncbi:bifunctional 4-hydroxy-3-methylbut-2-enyl diphosphate reductase/30S ribosomal protein S1 [Deferribacteres bacterium DY0037]
MEIFIADHAGFCFGVERAVSLVEDTSKQFTGVYTLGPIIHNPQIVSKFAENGIGVCYNPEEVNEDNTVVVRSHGVTKETYATLARRKVNVVDATCPFVKKAQNSAKKLGNEGAVVVVYGEKNHPEVKSIVSFIDSRYVIVSDVGEASVLPDENCYALVAQTTQNSESFDKIAEILKTKCDKLIIKNTICNATSLRQASAIDLAKKVDIMVVIGGRNSGNTTRLYEICKNICANTHHIETKEELKKEIFDGCRKVGITAGASTPGYLVEEVIEFLKEVSMSSINNNDGDNMQMEDFEAMLEESFQQPEKNSIVQGTVAQINENDVLVNIGFKTEGVVPSAEFMKDGEITIKVGDEVDVLFLGIAGGGGYVKLSRKAIEKEADWIEVEKALEEETPVEIKVTSVVDKGFTGKCGEIECFIPENHIDFKNSTMEPQEYVGNIYEVKVLKANKKQRSFLASRKLQMIQSIEKEKKEFFSQIEEGQILKGSVKTIKHYGAFMNFGAVDGFLRKNNIAWGVVKHPNQYIEEGDELEVKILNIDFEEEKLEVGLKQMQEDPWDSAYDKYPEGGTVAGTVVARKNKGFVMEIEQGIDGFIPLEEISWLKNARIAIEPKDAVEGKIIGIDDEKKKLIVSLKSIQENPWVTLKTKHPEGSAIKGTIKSITDFGIFVDFGEFLDGLIRKKDISWTDEPENLDELYKEGDEIEAKVLKIDAEKERISLGVKQLETNPWREIGKLLPNGKVVEVKVLAVSKEGLEVELPRDLIGFIPDNELDVEKVDPTDKFAVGDTIKAVVFRNDAREKKILLSIRRYMQDSEKREVKEYLKKLAQSDDSTFSLGNILKGKLDVE